jgi:Uma2 family endonuclease
MATAPSPPTSQRLLLYGVDWQEYRRFLRLFRHRRAIRLTYDRGALEIMTLSFEHERYGQFLGRLAVTLTEELGLPVMDGGSTTFRRRRKQRGLEPDNCYWIENEPRIRGKLKIDLRVDPPPDLAIEVDIASSSLNRMGIYATLKVPEVWRFDGTTLSFHLLGMNRKYTEISHSHHFPKITPGDLVRVLPLREQMDENAVIATFRTWVRHHHALGSSGQAP